MCGLAPNEKILSVGSPWGELLLSWATGSWGTSMGVFELYHSSIANTASPKRWIQPTAAVTVLVLAIVLAVSPFANAASTAADVSTYAGAAGVAGDASVTAVSKALARFRNPGGITLDSAGNVFIVDTGNNCIRKIAASTGQVTLFAGGGTAALFGTADGTGTAARFNAPTRLTRDASDNLYVCDTGNHSIRKITTAGVVTTYAGASGVSGSADANKGTDARFNSPQGIAMDTQSSNMFVSDTGNHTIRYISPAGKVTTVLGVAGTSGSADGIGTAARFNSPEGITQDTAKNLYVADTGNNTIRKITISGSTYTSSTVAGTAGQTGTADGTGAAVRFNAPGGITADSAGTMFITDTGNHTIREMSAAGVTTTVAGKAGVVGSADGIGPAARFSSPTAIVTTAAHLLYIADTGNHTVRTASPTPSYWITASTGPNGTISETAAIPVSSGGSKTFTMTPNEGYHVANVIVDGASVGAVSSYTFSNIAADHTISVTFAINTYTLTPSAGSNGAISPATAQTVNWGTSKTFTFTPNTGYHVLDVKVDGVSVGEVNSYTFDAVSASHTISVTFVKNSFTITTSAGANGAVSPSGAQTVAHDADLTVTITPNTNYHVEDVLVDGVSVGAVESYTFTSVAADHTLSAVFSSGISYDIVASHGTGGSITPAGTAVLDIGESLTCTITPDTGYHVADVKVDGASVGAVSTYTFSNVSANHTIEATFAINTYGVSVSAGANGSVSPSGTRTVSYGGGLSVTITPDTGYHVADVKVDGVSVGALATYEFTEVTAAHSLEASFSINVSSVQASAGVGGTISPSGTISMTYGEKKVFAITASQHYHVADVTVDGISVGAVSAYQLTALEATHAVVATFAPDSYTITPSAGDGGTISPSAATQVSYGGSATFSVTADALYQIADVKVDGVSVGAVAEYTFASVVSSHTIDASFAPADPWYQLFEPPVVGDVEVDLDARSSANKVVASVPATDPADLALTFEIVSGNGGGVFAVDSQGVITTARAVPSLYTTPTYTLVVRVTNSEGLYGDSTVGVALYNVEKGNASTTQLDHGVSLKFTSVGKIGIARAQALTPRQLAPVGAKYVAAGYYDITNTSNYTGGVLVTLPYDSAAVADPSKLVIGHYTGGRWEILTTSVDTTAHTVTGTSTSFSDYAVLETGIAANETPASPTSVPASSPRSIALMIVVAFGILIGVGRVRRQTAASCG